MRKIHEIFLAWSVDMLNVVSLLMVAVNPRLDT